MTFKITIQEGKTKVVFNEVDGYFLIVSDPDGFKGIKMVTSAYDSLPRQIGWVQWALWHLHYKANYLFGIKPAIIKK